MKQEIVSEEEIGIWLHNDVSINLRTRSSGLPSPGGGSDDSR